jgi:hypothetical protein
LINSLTNFFSKLSRHPFILFVPIQTLGQTISHFPWISTVDRNLVISLHRLCQLYDIPFLPIGELAILIVFQGHLYGNQKCLTFHFLIVQNIINVRPTTSNELQQRQVRQQRGDSVTE